MKPTHPLLAIQLRKALGFSAPEDISDYTIAALTPAKLRTLLAAVNASYHGNEEQNTRFAHALQISTNEANTAVDDLREINREKEATLDFIREQLDILARQHPGIITQDTDKEHATRLIERFHELLVGWQTLISQLENARQLAEELRADADRANAAKSIFLASMSHEIRTPLNGIIGMSALIQQTQLTPAQQEHATTIHNCGETLLSLIDDILDYTKIEAGNLELEPTPFLLREAMEDSLELFKYTVAQKHIELLFYPDPRVPKAFCGDITRFRQIITNLVSNAVKFTSNGEVFVHIKPNLQAERKGKWLVEVRDSGLGIAPEKIPRLFKVFSQADATISHQYGGTGLGLAISKILVEAMGGEIWVTSQENKGSTFYYTFDIPIWTGHIQAKHPATAPFPIQGRTVLILDDNPTNITILKDVLHRWKANVISHRSPEKALAWLETHDPPVLIITDQEMPQMLGTEFIQRVEKILTPPPPVLVLTSVDIPVSMRNGHTIATKPIREADLATTIASLIGKTSPAPPSPHHNKLRFLKFPAKMLVAEDNDVNRRLFELVLDSMGITATFAHHGKEALEHVLEHQPEIILMDVRMPEMDGYEATAAIRKLGTTIRQPQIIGLTANALTDERSKGLTVGMDDYLTKPIVFESLFNALIQACRKACTEQPVIDDSSDVHI